MRVISVIEHMFMVDRYIAAIVISLAFSAIKSIAFRCSSRVFSPVRVSKIPFGILVIALSVKCNSSSCAALRNNIGERFWTSVNELNDRFIVRTPDK